jgi:hypothetical protein
MSMMNHIVLAACISCLIVYSYGSDNLLVFGVAGGAFYPLSSIAEQDLIFYEDSVLHDVITSIQIGAVRYGYNGGEESFRVKVPSDGKFYLKAMQTPGSEGKSVSLNYFTAIFDGYQVYSGANLPRSRISFISLQPNGTLVELTGLNADENGIYSLQFSIMNNISFVFGSIDPADSLCIKPDGALYEGILSYNRCGTNIGYSICGLAINNTPICGSSGSGGWTPIVPITKARNNFLLQFLQAANDGPNGLTRYMSYLKGQIEGQYVEIGQRFTPSDDPILGAWGTLTLYNLPLTLIGMYIDPGNSYMDSMAFSNMV